MYCDKTPGPACWDPKSLLSGHVWLRQKHARLALGGGVPELKGSCLLVIPFGAARPARPWHVDAASWRDGRILVGTHLEAALPMFWMHLLPHLACHKEAAAASGRSPCWSANVQYLLFHKLRTRLRPVLRCSATLSAPAHNGAQSQLSAASSASIASRAAHGLHPSIHPPAADESIRGCPETVTPVLWRLP